MTHVAEQGVHHPLIKFYGLPEIFEAPGLVVPLVKRRGLANTMANSSHLIEAGAHQHSVNHNDEESSYR